MAMVENRAAGTEFPAAEIHFSRTVPATPPQKIDAHVEEDGCSHLSCAQVYIGEDHSQPAGIKKLIEISVDQAEQDAGHHNGGPVPEHADPVDQQPAEHQLLKYGSQNGGKQDYRDQISLEHHGYHRVVHLPAQKQGGQSHEHIADEISPFHDSNTDEKTDSKLSQGHGAEILRGCRTSGNSSQKQQKDGKAGQVHGTHGESQPSRGA